MTDQERNQTLAELENKSFDYRDGFIAGMKFAQKVYSPLSKQEVSA